MTRQEEVAAGLQTLTEIFKKSGLNIRETKRPWPDRDATYLVSWGALASTANAVRLARGDKSENLPG